MATGWSKIKTSRRAMYRSSSQRGILRYCPRSNPTKTICFFCLKKKQGVRKRLTRWRPRMIETWLFHIFKRKMEWAIWNPKLENLKADPSYWARDPSSRRCTQTTTKPSRRHRGPKADPRKIRKKLSRLPRNSIAAFWAALWTTRNWISKTWKSTKS